MFRSITLGQKISAGIIVCLVAIMAVVFLVEVFPTATNQGYAPDQPIPFSHRLHAGINKIDCRYCHSSVEQSRVAGIPSMNVCMNCHREVKTDSPYIKQLTQAFEEGRPIEWTRVHELPDFVFFNHKPHVLNGVSCETCHGDVKTMDKIVQAQPLTMGWCLDCHRGKSTPKKVLAKYHPQLEKPKGHPVAPINCTTCHY